jgi:hypothetical protein
MSQAHSGNVAEIDVTHNLKPASKLLGASTLRNDPQLINA